MDARNTLLTLKYNSKISRTCKADREIIISCFFSPPVARYPSRRKRRPMLRYPYLKQKSSRKMLLVKAWIRIHSISLSAANGRVVPNMKRVTRFLTFHFFHHRVTRFIVQAGYVPILMEFPTLMHPNTRRMVFVPDVTRGLKPQKIHQDGHISSIGATEITPLTYLTE